MPCLQGDKPTSSDAQPTPKPATLQALRTDIQGQGPSRFDAQPTPKPATLQALRTDIQGQGPSQSTPETGIASNNKMDSIGSTDRGEGLSETRQGEQSESERKLADLNKELADLNKELADSRKKLESVEEIEDQEFDNVIKEQGKYEENSEEQKENLDKRYEEERTKYIAQMRDLYGQLEKM